MLESFDSVVNAAGLFELLECSRGGILALTYDLGLCPTRAECFTRDRVASQQSGDKIAVLDQPR